MMDNKKILVLIFLYFSFTLLFADYAITRGPDVGEIYFIGPTATGEGIYRSTDFGEIATCMDSISEVESICADITLGSLYRVRMPDCLYYSNNYGQYGSWIFRSNNISSMNSGKTEGYIYNGKAQHSEDYGVTFINHLCQGFFGNLKAAEIDNENNIGYALVRESDILDSLWLLISYDNYENLEIQHVFNDYIGTNRLTRGYENGELFLYRKHNLHGKKLLYSNDYGETWELTNTFNCPNLPIKSIVGGRQPGELFMNIEYAQLMGQIKHTYIYHSLDYGETFTVYHPFAYGPDPYITNFEAEPTTGTAPLTVQFTDLSSGGNILGWEWDFENDGIIDSYEQNPEYTYQDTGSYSVRLSIDFGGFDFLIRQNYIHVTDGSGADNYELGIRNYELNNYPNPFNPETTIRFTTEHTESPEDIFIEIYNVKG
ncbi:MAG: PKD domain-containing protein, partial [Candidatus Cloacimonetes bacterium]|nr:PKD domain-containing protein [Candidatus Cloacimonadota bacterium]